MKQNHSMRKGWQSRALRLLAVALVPLALAGCPNEAPEAPTPVANEYHIGWGIYDARGIVISLPAEGQDLMIKHEAIPTFLNIKGEPVGMQAMQMPFPLGEGVSLEGIAVDDIVAFTFEVDWDPGYYLTSIKVLPENTELDFSDRDPPTIYKTGP